jgi:osmotically-inducible protein OsmY
MPMLESPTLAERVEGAIAENPYFSSRQLRFETEDGRVVLSGVVGTYFQKQMAQEIVRRIEGVREIDNCLEVKWHAPGSAEFELRIAE